jgi:exosortase A-associated hydrolase 2
MNPMFFGSSQRSLFGVYHPSTAATARREAVLLCYPFGQEYMRAHRAFRQLAILLSKAGYHVLRFDYFGTGDSAGNTEDATVEQWVADVGTAVDELKDTAGVKSVSIVGLRLGGALAAMAQAQRTDIDRLALWDPVVEGKRYVEALITSVGAAPRLAADQAARDVVGTVGINGFPLTDALRRSVAAIDLVALPLPKARQLAIVVSEERDDYQRLVAAWQTARPGLVYRCIPSSNDWGVVDNYGSALLPQEIVQGIVGCFTQEKAA